MFSLRYEWNLYTLSEVREGAPRLDIAQAVIRRLLAVKGQVRSQVSPNGFFGGQNGTGIVFLRVLVF